MAKTKRTKPRIWGCTCRWDAKKQTCGCGVLRNHFHWPHRMYYRTGNQLPVLFVFLPQSNSNVRRYGHRLRTIRNGTVPLLLVKSLAVLQPNDRCIFSELVYFHLPDVQYLQVENYQSNTFLIQCTVGSLSKQ